jgi:4-carboxymuconolactone decarboxylase
MAAALFLKGAATMSDAYENGLAMRRKVMGDAFVDRALANATEFTEPLQRIITENAWGTVWCRGGIDLKTRSLITVAMLTALGRQHELAGHVQGALNNGAGQDEIREVLLHAAIYCGVPLAAEAFRCAAEVFETGLRDEARRNVHG